MKIKILYVIFILVLIMQLCDFAVFAEENVENEELVLIFFDINGNEIDSAEFNEISPNIVEEVIFPQQAEFIKVSIDGIQDTYSCEIMINDKVYDKEFYDISDISTCYLNILLRDTSSEYKIAYTYLINRMDIPREPKVLECGFSVFDIEGNRYKIDNIIVADNDKILIEVPFSTNVIALDFIRPENKYTDTDVVETATGASVIDEFYEGISFDNDSGQYTIVSKLDNISDYLDIEFQRAQEISNDASINSLRIDWIVSSDTVNQLNSSVINIEDNQSKYVVEYPVDSIGYWYSVEKSDIMIRVMQELPEMQDISEYILIDKNHKLKIKSVAENGSENTYEFIFINENEKLKCIIMTFYYNKVDSEYLIYYAVGLLVVIILLILVFVLKRK